MKTLSLLPVALLVAACSGSSADDTILPTGDSGAPGDGAMPSDGAGGGDSSMQGDTGGGGDGASGGCAGYAYCDDFESYPMGDVKNGATLGPWKASVGGMATMAVDNVKPHAGAQSLHITVPAGTSANGTLRQMAAAGLVPGNNLFGRAMVFYSTSGGNDLPLGVHSWIFNASGNSAASGGTVTMNVANNGNSYFLNYHPAMMLPEQSVSGGKPMGGAWLCMQWEYDGSGMPPVDEAKIWVDGTQVVDATPAKKWDFATPWTQFDFGFTHYQTTTKPVDVYLDDFALNGSMVPCP